MPKLESSMKMSYELRIRADIIQQLEWMQEDEVKSLAEWREHYGYSEVTYPDEEIMPRYELYKEEVYLKNELLDKCIKYLSKGGVI